MTRIITVKKSTIFLNLWKSYCFSTIKGTEFQSGKLLPGEKGKWTVSFLSAHRKYMRFQQNHVKRNWLKVDELLKTKLGISLDTWEPQAHWSSSQATWRCSVERLGRAEHGIKLRWWYRHVYGKISGHAACSSLPFSQSHSNPWATEVAFIGVIGTNSIGIWGKDWEFPLQMP